MKGIILQSDSGLNRSINNYGCYMMSIIYLACRHLNKDFKTIEDILHFYKIWVDKDYMERDCTIKKPDKIFSDLGVGVTNRQAYKNADFVEQTNQLCVQAWFNDKLTVHYTHFVASWDNRVVYDPLGDSNTVKQGYLKSKRVFNIKE